MPAEPECLSAWFSEHSSGQTQTKRMAKPPKTFPRGCCGVSPGCGTSWSMFMRRRVAWELPAAATKPFKNMKKDFSGCFLISLFALTTVTGTWRGIGYRHQGARAFVATPHLCHLEWCCHNTAHSQLYTVPLLKSLLWGQIIISYIMWPLAKLTKASWRNQHAWN